MERIAIIGAGQAAAALASRLRQQGYAGDITLFGNESNPPYQRPPLSKKYLSGEWARERLWIRPPEYWRDHRITLALGMNVDCVDLTKRSLRSGGQWHFWDKLVFSTGAAPRPLPDILANRQNVFELRSLDDVERLRPAFLPGRRLLVVGGGYIGLEIAAVAAQTGLSVTLVESAPRILQRVASKETADSIRELHERHGVRFHEGRMVRETEGVASIDTVVLDNGVRLECDLIVAGIGVMANTAVAAGAGVSCNDGIVVNEFGRTSADAVWAAGDCAEFPWQGALTRLESVQNAIDQAEAVADDIMGNSRPYAPVPWFWSDQYDVKLQIAGLNRGYDTVVSRKSERGRSNWYFRQEQLIAIDALNDGRAYMAGKKLLEARDCITSDDVRCPDFDPVVWLRRR